MANSSEKLIVDNRRARHDYHLLERIEAVKGVKIPVQRGIRVLTTFTSFPPRWRRVGAPEV
jgi:hypothetical protein